MLHSPASPPYTGKQPRIPWLLSDLAGVTPVHREITIRQNRSNPAPQHHPRTRESNYSRRSNVTGFMASSPYTGKQQCLFSKHWLFDGIIPVCGEATRLECGADVLEWHHPRFRGSNNYRPQKSHSGKASPPYTGKQFNLEIRTKQWTGLTPVHGEATPPHSH